MISHDLVGVLKFANKSVLMSLTEIDKASLKTFEKRISEVEVPGANKSSGISKALIDSCQELVDNGRAPSRAGILISDGVETDVFRPLGVLTPEQCYIDHGWPIYTIGIGNVREYALGEIRLRQLAEDTGGEFIPISDITTLICEMQQLRSRAAGVESRPCISRDLGQDKSTLVYVTVPPLQLHATFSLNWDSGRINLRIFRPSDDTRPSYSSATAPREVVRIIGDTNVIYKIPNPEPGVWKIELYRRPNKDGDKATSRGDLPAVFGFSSLPAP